MLDLPTPEPIPRAAVWPPRRPPGSPPPSLTVSPDLQKRLWFTLCALIVYRLGTYLPLPGIDPQILEDVFRQQQGGILGLFDLFTGGALWRMSIFALGIIPYISAAIIMELMTAVSPEIGRLKKEGERGRQKINQYTRYGTILLAAVQGYGIAIGIEGMTGSQGPAVTDPGLFFRATTVITLVGGAVFLMWLAEQITSRGVGNGISLIIFSGIVAQLPGAIAATAELGRTGALSIPQIAGLIAMVAFIIILIVFVERAQRRILVQYPERQVGARMFGGRSSYLPLRINTAGIIPPAFTASILLMPVTFAGLTVSQGPEWLITLTAYLGRGQPIFMALYGALIVFFAFFYTAVVFNPADTAENLKNYGGNIAGIRPGGNTADYLDFILTRLTTIGALYLALISLLPEFLLSWIGAPFYFGGMSLLIVVMVTMDTVAQFQEFLKSGAKHTGP
ncbi:MAG: preprotein translocase subunit SecY [Proteobacteria bacterium]|nr:preprotein translocase subunit SecY [Pseudomonadota bacterium]